MELRMKQEKKFTNLKKASWKPYFFFFKFYRICLKKK